MLSKKDIELLKKAIKEKDKYTISVDNDSITVISNNDEDDYYEDFDTWGQDFIVDILQYLGANADYC